jgi:NADH-quinone oxidoreductase subunit D
MSDIKNIEATEVQKEYNILNLGPTHPATHGIFQNVLKMDGEIIYAC